MKEKDLYGFLFIKGAGNHTSQGIKGIAITFTKPRIIFGR